MKKFMVVFIVTLTISCQARTIYVDNDNSADYSIIQDAINVSEDGDTIVVRPGIYHENIHFNGKRITLTNLNPDDIAMVESTVIDGGQKDSVVTFYQNETNQTVITGVTITNGKAEKGCGILCWNGASPTIEKCRIIDHYTEVDYDNRYGGGIYCENGNPVISGCYIAGNSAWVGGGIYCIEGNATISNCVIDSNYTDWGGGIRCTKGSTIIIDCIVQNNYAVWGGGGINIDNAIGQNPAVSAVTVSNCIVIGNYGYQGGGICCWGPCIATIVGCNISNNEAGYGGGGIKCNQSTPTISECEIINNYAYKGGGIDCSHGSSPAITMNKIEMNTASWTGGGIMCYVDCYPIISQCILLRNFAEQYGGGAIFTEHSSPEIANCVIAGNDSNGSGGGIHFYTDSETSLPSVNSCSIIGNRAKTNGSGLFFSQNSAPFIPVTNCIISNNQGVGVYWKFTTDKALSYNNVWGNSGGNYGGWATAGLGSISVDPIFVDNGNWDTKGTPDDTSDDTWINGDYHLKSTYGRWDVSAKQWIQDNITSPCIDAGDPSLDWRDELYPHGMRLNMGAFGGTVEASMSSSLAGNIADLNKDNIVNLLDLAIVGNRWLLSQAPLIKEDINRDGAVDILDLLILSEVWLTGNNLLIYKNPLDVDPGWTIEGEWNFGQPLGLGGTSYGNPDPMSGYTGINVYGINLQGDYNPSIGVPYYLTTGPIDCRDFENVKVSFMSWLNIDSSRYAQCSFEVSTNGTEWMALWNNTPDPITENEWNRMEFDISDHADNQNTLYLRWRYQIIDRAYPYSGWNIDNVELWGTL